MNVTLRQLRAFLAVAEARHFRVAAERLHLTQPAVSRHVSGLEAQLGARLFDRNTRGVVPTAIGEQLRRGLARVLADLDEVLAQARAEGEGWRGTVRVAAGPTPSATLLPDCIASCRRDYPELTVLSYDRIQLEVVDAVRRGEVDFGVVIEPLPGNELHIETILRDAVVLICRHDHPLARLQRVRWTRLQGESVVLLDRTSGSRRLVDAALARHRVKVRVVQQTGHTHTAYRMVEAGLGCSIMPGLSASLSPRLVARPLVPAVRYAIALVRRRNRSLSPAAERVWARMGELACTIRWSGSQTTPSLRRTCQHRAAW